MTTRYQKLTGVDDSFDTNTHMEGGSSSHSRRSFDQRRCDLEDTFDEVLDDDDNDHHESHRLLETSSSSVPASDVNTTQSTIPDANRPAVLPVTNDGVFSNMSAKPESHAAKVDETPPAYDEAMADATPPYWQTTVIAPAGMGDMIFVEGMPVGNMLSFAWNLLVSASFQFVGFMLTYLLHTSHAAKQGSRAGLGVSLVQTGFYIRSRGSLDDGYYDDEGGNSDKNGSDESSGDADIIAYFLMMLGWFIIIRAIADYARARNMEKIIGAEPNADAMV
ncbi:uncharacterized protein BYT42DRAFT_517130 [Radiomyces spectabilis]|uniref:uncharacterized protein n=1 Tax=Radiomyces spectabilis TaxID=64574 RepID=UPI00221FC1D8|nr:uncharacterized protein BYT42DRAFT_517130 [Radiomyces spectabilis]KAI8376285.1 hypothetical protein BYT42DRAFT_517130 [Radiomyces spectabilis]